MSDEWDEIDALIEQDRQVEKEYQRFFEVGCIVECTKENNQGGITKSRRYLVLQVGEYDLWIFNNCHEIKQYHQAYFKRVHFIP